MQVSYSLTTAEPATGTSACWTWIQEMGGNENADPIWVRFAGLTWAPDQSSVPEHAPHPRGPGVDRLVEAIDAIKAVEHAAAGDIGKIISSFFSAYRLFDVARPEEGERFHRPETLLAAFLCARAVRLMRTSDPRQALGDIALIQDLVARGVPLGADSVPYLATLQAGAQRQVGLGTAPLSTVRHLDAFLLRLRARKQDQVSTAYRGATSSRALARKLKRAQRRSLREAWTTYRRTAFADPHRTPGSARGGG